MWINRFSLTLMNDPIDPVLDGILSKAIEKKISGVSSTSEYRIKIEFQDGLIFESWNANRYYSWLCSGEIVFPDKTTYTWRDGRPSRATMSKIYNLLKNYSK